MNAQEFVENFPLRDLQNAETVGFQVGHNGQRVWLCINGQCVLRIKGIFGKVEIRDDRLEGLIPGVMEHD